MDVKDIAPTNESAAAIFIVLMSTSWESSQLHCINLRRGPLLEFNVGSHPGDSTHYVNAKDMLSLSLLQARLIDLKLPIKILEGE